MYIQYKLNLVGAPALTHRYMLVCQRGRMCTFTPVYT